ncbi:class I SAM-dependent methyltransferase [Amycolatopsis balhimycina DSM 5908]|uniref:Class I SAM-dependent methyltransferase n=1 Tax=Amycolatopsis balhimycina DSM 5908 TaxID=1081091 RepID=A0A428WPB9_AMYBA|nr:class I SAM-dependent methyltransferase [Amycolatopsis balhimycina]RSM44868.1 class I SAM-dependent methyltransferase [Amycolatopsis balhimycina DSM 5908]
MIATKELPEQYGEWNWRWGAPFGFSVENSVDVRHRFDDEDPKRYGPFGFQRNSLTRFYEYPWAFFTADLQPGMRVIDVGGWLSGFQVTLADAGCEVFNVDPSVPEDTRWTTSLKENQPNTARDQHATFLSYFDADVTLIERPLQAVDLPEGTFDRIFAISVLEHVDQGEAGEIVDAMRRLLKPGGRAVLTIDLFFDLPPFGMLPRNFWGINIDVGALVKNSGMDMVHGNPAELLGFPEFDPERVVANIDSYNLSALYPVASQLVVLEKRAG